MYVGLLQQLFSFLYTCMLTFTKASVRYNYGHGPSISQASDSFHSVQMMVIHTVAGYESFDSIAG